VAVRWLICVVYGGQVDLGDMENEVRVAEDAAKKAMADAQRMSEDLRKQADAASSAEKQRRSFETQVCCRLFYVKIVNKILYTAHWLTCMSICHLSLERLRLRQTEKISKYAYPFATHIFHIFHIFQSLAFGTRGSTHSSATDFLNALGGRSVNCHHRRPARHVLSGFLSHFSVLMLFWTAKYCWSVRPTRPLVTPDFVFNCFVFNPFGIFTTGSKN